MSATVLEVALANSNLKASIDKEDFDELMSLGVSPRFILAPKDR